jgi:hypothetical protein
MHRRFNGTVLVLVHLAGDKHDRGRHGAGDHAGADDDDPKIIQGYIEHDCELTAGTSPGCHQIRSADEACLPQLAAMLRGPPLPQPLLADRGQSHRAALLASEPRAGDAALGEAWRVAVDCTLVAAVRARHLDGQAFGRKVAKGRERGGERHDDDMGSAGPT